MSDLHPLKITTFGGLAIHIAEVPITSLGTRKAEALLVYLAVTGRAHSREALADFLWDDLSQSRALTNLRVTLTSLRKHVEPYLAITRDLVGLSPQAPVWSDVTELQAKLSVFQEQEGIHSPDVAYQAAQALELYRGEFLEGFFVRKARGFEAWATQERERLHHLVLDALQETSKFHLETGSHQQGIAMAHRLLQLDPLMEPAHRQLMLLLASSGQRSAALAQFETLQSLLEDELGVEPAEATLSLRASILSGEPLRTPDEDAAPELPSGTVIFLFTDLEDSLKLLETLHDRFPQLLTEQRRILRAVFSRWQGREIDVQNDRLFVSFPRATDAVAAAAAAQRALAEHTGPEGVALRARMGLHTGEPWLVEQGYVGMDVHRAAQLGHTSHGGQVLLSETTTALVREELPDGVGLLDLGRHRLQDVRRAVHIHQLTIAGLPSDFPPLNSVETIALPDLFEPETITRLPREVGACPYRGLAAFREVDAEFFFGRETFTEQLAAAVRQRRLAAVIVGPSGSGKSSAVFAGLLPHLRAEGDWLLLTFRPSGQPFYALAVALIPYLESGLDETDRLKASHKLADGLAAGEVYLHHTIQRILEKSPGIRQVLLVIDQFEELYTLCPETSLRNVFQDELLAAVNAVSGERPNPMAVLLTMRADFMGHALGHRPFADALQEGSLMLGPMNRDELQAAIEMPAELQGAAFETGLIYRILDDVGEEPGNLPLLEFALTLLWEQMEEGWLTHAVYEQIGRVEGALARYADEVFNALEPDEQEQARRIFVQLVQPGQGTEDTRRVAQQADLASADWALIQHLADKRLVVTSRDEAGVKTVEVVHEALISGWGQLRDWMVADRAFRNWQEGLRAGLRGWEASGGDEGALQRGSPLTQSEDWLSKREGEIGAAERAYIQASVALQERLRVERERRRRMVIGGLAAGLVVALLLSVFAFSQRGSAQQNAALAIRSAATADAEALARATQQGLAEGEADARATQQAIAESEAAARATQQAVAEQEAQTSLSRELAAAAISNLDADPERSILLALQALATAHTVEAENALHLAVQSSPIRHSVNIHPDSWLEWFTFSPDRQQWFISGWGGGSMWDVSSGNLMFAPSVPEGDWINLAAFSPDGSLLLLPGESYDSDGNDLPGIVTIVDAKSGQEILNFNAHDFWVQVVAFSPDGTLFATGSGDLSVKIWDLESTLADREGRLVRTLCCHQEWIGAVAFSPDGNRVVSLAFGGERAKIWDLATGEELFNIGPGVVHVNYSPDGKYLVTVSLDDLIQVWDAETGERLSTAFSSDDTFSNDIALSPDGSLLAISKLSGRVELWRFSPEAMQEARTILGHTDQVYGVAFSPDGNRLYTTSLDGTIRTWDVSPTGSAEIFASADGLQITDLGLIEDGNKLVTVGGDGLLRVWDTSTWEEVTNFRIQDGLVNGLAVSPDGVSIATAGSDGKVKVFDTTTWKEILNIDAHLVDDSHPFYFGAYDVSFSPNGERLVTGGIDKTIKIWNTDTGDQLLSLSGHTGSIIKAQFSPDGRFVAIGAGEIPGIWNASTGALLQTFAADDWLSAVNRAFWSVAFSPEGSRLAFGRADGVFEVWKLPDGVWDPEIRSAELLYKRATGVGFMMALRFSPDGEHIILGGNRGIMQVRDADSGDLLLNQQFDSVMDLETTPDGKRLVLVNDESLQVLALDLDELIALAKSRVTRTFTTEECLTYLHLEECP